MHLQPMPVGFEPCPDLCILVVGGVVLNQNRSLAAVAPSELFEEAEVGAASALDKKELPALEPGAMCYMMSKRQYLSDQGASWHPHLMFFVAGDAAKGWGADLPGSPIMAANDPEERTTILMVWVGNWSDGRWLRRWGTDPNSIVEEAAEGQ